MPVYALNRKLVFPPPHLSEPSGMLALGGDLSPDRLVLAYSSGIFPWYGSDLPILWYSPDPRYVLEPLAAHIPRSLRKTMRRGQFEVNFDTRFGEVMRRCAETPRPDQDATWITEDMILGYERLHALGLAHSIETFEAGRLVGGLYGVSIGGMFFGESMFTEVPDASKVAFATLVAWLPTVGVELVDCQVHTNHLARFGAEAWPRIRYLAELEKHLRKPTLRGTWTPYAASARALQRGSA